MAGCMALTLLLWACGRPAGNKKESPNPRPALTPEVMLKTTPVKNQGMSDLCWAYAMLATIETEHLMQGDSVNLSADYVARMFLEQQARQRFISRGQSPISLRGTAPMLLHLIHTYGLTPYDSYHATDPLPNYRVIARRLEQAADHASSLQSLQRRLSDIMDQAVGFMPSQHVYMLGAVYTPLEFAHSVCQSDEYIHLTSFTHHPFGQSFTLELPDNRMNDTYLNLPIDTLIDRIESALRQGHAVCWEGDISDKGFSFKDGFARMDPTIKATQALRQRLFETHRTTDDHCMALVGIVRDAQGRKYYAAKNSWGVDNAFDGFVYMDENYLRLNTIAVTLKR